ncbi:MAG: SMP-30/gluconolactonase/LRE family protein [Burkholderiales bacterium]
MRPVTRLRILTPSRFMQLHFRPDRQRPATVPVHFAGCGLVRPECVLATRSGDLFTADWRGGVAHVRPDGSQALYAGTLPDGRPARPNGIALCRGGRFLAADLGETTGGVFELTREGVWSEYLVRVDGVDLPPSNFVTEDHAGRLWITVSTRLAPRALAYNARVADGFIVLVDQAGARIVADGLGYTNEAHVSPDGRHLYVNETFHRKLSRFPLTANGTAGPKEVVTEFGPGAFPDGMAFDQDGGVWIACVLGNQLIRVDRDGSQERIIDDGDVQHVAAVEQAWLGATLGRTLMDRPHTGVVRNLASVAFGGPDRRTVFLGNLGGDSIPYFRLPDDCPWIGHAPAHWEL